MSAARGQGVPAPADDRGVTQERAYRSAVSRRYNEIGVIWDPADRWHEIVRREVQTAVRCMLEDAPAPRRMVIDVGSGGLPQDVPHRDYVQVDIADARLAGLTLAACADAHSLPFRAHIADCVLCVGSVANYCDLAQLVTELARIAAPGAEMVLHVELTNSLEFLFRPMFRADRAFVTTHYQSGPERTWCYSLKYVQRQLDRSGFSVVDRRFFHTASALAYRLGVPPSVASRLALLDPLIRRIPGALTIGDSVILTCRRSDRI